MSTEPAAPPPVGDLPDGQHCPVCGSPLAREHRQGVDRWISVFRTVHRYHCTNPSCGWQGLLGRLPAALPPRPVVLARTRALWFVAGAVLTLAAVQGARLWRDARQPVQLAAAPPWAAHAARTAPPGIDFDGVLLPEHDDRVAQNATPLSIRRNCAWGVPGGNPYKGSVEHALAAARLPPEVVAHVADLARRGVTHGQVQITREGIRTVDGTREFGTHIPAMAYGETLCLNMRVNFKPGHVEYGDFYEATDRMGQTYSIMVPYVCSNVSVLGERGVTGGTNGHGVPTPATWALVALGLALIALGRRRHGGSQ